MKRARLNQPTIFSLAIFTLIALGFAWVSQSQKDTCRALEGSAKINCVQNKVDTIIKRQGIKESLAFVNQYREIDRQFTANDCHPLMHYIGEKGFELYKRHQKLDLDDNATGCNFGFYHAFMTNFALEEKMTEAVEFCDQIIVDQSLDAGKSCYHGLGHGVVYVYAEDLGFPSLLDIILEGSNMCQQLLNNEPVKVTECLSGVYGGLMDIVSDNPDYVDQLSVVDQYALCLSQPPVYQGNCYENIAMLVLTTGGQDWDALVDLIMRETSIVDKWSAVRGLAASFVSSNSHDIKTLQDGLPVCQKLNQELKDSCIEMMSVKLFRESDALSRADKVKSFCSTQSLSEAEKDVCLFAKNSDLREALFTR